MRADDAWAGAGRMRMTLMAKRHSRQVQKVDAVTAGHKPPKSFDAPNVVSLWASASSSVKWEL